MVTIRRVPRALLVLVSTVLILLGLSVPATGAANTAAERPFKLSWTGTFEVVFDADWCDPGWVGVTIHATDGHATHLGQLTGDAYHCDNFATGELADGIVVLVAANGDELHGTYEGMLLPSEPGTARIAATQTYNGGTGRFTHATGSADESTWAIFLSETTGLVGGTMVGTLSYDAADRSR